MSFYRTSLTMFLVASLHLVFIVGAVVPSCDPSFNSGFGLGAKDLPPANMTPTAPPTGPFPVGVRFESFCFEGRRLTLNYWYPAIESATSVPYVSAGGILGEAVQDAPVDSSGGPYPLVLFSTGVGAVDDAYYFYTQNLASNGYVVVSIQHFDARYANITTNVSLLLLAALDASLGNTNDAVIELYTDWFRDTEYALTYRPQEIEFALDQTIQSASNTSSPFYGVIDTDNIGMSGHSLGGFYSNIVGGGMPIYCDYIMTPAQMDPTWPIMAEVSPCAFPARQSLSDPFALHDSRIKAIITLAAPTFLTKTQLARSALPISTPMMIITGDNTTSETPAWIQREIYDNSGGPSYWVQVRDTNHYLVADSYGLNPVLAAAMSANDRANFQDKAAVYMSYSTAFFDYYIKGNTSASSTLDNVYSSYVVELSSRNK